MAVDTTLAQLSNTLVYSAMLVYTGALGAFTTDLAVRGRRRVAEPTLEGAVPVDALVTAAAGTGTGTGGAGSPAADAGAADRLLESAEHSAEPVTEPSAGTLGAGSKAAGIAVSLTWLAFALHLAGVAARGASAQRVPWGNMYEFSVSGALVVTGVFLAVLLRRDVRYLGTFVIGPVLLTLGLAVTVFYTQSAQLVPALRTWTRLTPAQHSPASRRPAALASQRPAVCTLAHWGSLVPEALAGTRQVGLRPPAVVWVCR